MNDTQALNNYVSAFKKSIKHIWECFSNIDKKIIKVKFTTEKCSYCEVQNAKWKNTTLNAYVCDECVPRGCSCRLYKKTNRAPFSIQNYDYEKDKQGKDMPCEDWEKYPKR